MPRRAIATRRLLRADLAGTPTLFTQASACAHWSLVDTRGLRVNRAHHPETPSSDTPNRLRQQQGDASAKALASFCDHGDFVRCHSLTLSQLLLISLCPV
jgi:hypothetical protein